VAEAPRGIAERRGDGVQAVEPDGAAGRVRAVGAGGVVALAVRAMEVVARAVLMLAVGVVKRLALGAGASVVWLPVRAWGTGTLALRAGVLRGDGLALALGRSVALLVPIVVLALVAGGVASPAATTAAVGATVGGRPV
jgi:hypothetical protein